MAKSKQAKFLCGPLTNATSDLCSICMTRPLHIQKGIKKTYVCLKLALLDVICTLLQTPQKLMTPDGECGLCFMSARGISKYLAEESDGNLVS